MRSVFAAAVLLASVTGAFAQTAEETVRYLMTGFEGKTITASQGPLNGSYDNDQEAPDHAAMFVSGQIEDKWISTVVYTVKFTQVSDCVYDADGKVIEKDKYIRTGNQSFLTYKIRYDFTKGSGIDLSNYKRGDITKIRGATTECLGEDRDLKSCGGTIENFYANFGEKDRLDKAWAYFRSTYCKGSAF